MDGRRLKRLNPVDSYSRVPLAIRIGRHCKALDVIDAIEECKAVSGTHPSADGPWARVHCPCTPGMVYRQEIAHGIDPTRFTLGASIREVNQQPA